MSWWYRNLVRPVLFTQDAEEVHNRTLRALAWIGSHGMVCDAAASFFRSPSLPIEVFGLKFPNPIGLAAGMDKCANALPAWKALGFGFTELGGVTWHGQPGNPAPRLFRAVPERVIINRMGFNNPGAEAIANTLAKWRELGPWPSHPVGINLGKSKITPLEKAPEDYANSFRMLREHADFFVVNVSSPNTPNLRQLQDKGALEQILKAIQEVESVEGSAARSADQPTGTSAIRAAGEKAAEGSRTPRPIGDTHGSRDARSVVECGCPLPLSSAESSYRRFKSHPADTRPYARPKPILVKVAPDLSLEALDEILELVGPCKIAGIVATNTTITRPETNDAELRRIYAEPGGLSGPPLRARSTEIVRHLYRRTKGKLPIIGVGGIFDAADAWEKITAGASLIQIYTGLVYEGPGVASAIVRGLLRHLEERGMTTLREAVGSAASK